jgi:hypothetical protein
MNSVNHTSIDTKPDPAALLFPITKHVPDRESRLPEKPVSGVPPGKAVSTQGHGDPLSLRGHPEVDSPLAG